MSTDSSTDWAAGPAGAAAAIVLLTLTVACAIWSATSRVSRVGPTPAPHATPAPVSELRIDPNRATVGELQLLPGIGPALAARIISTRATRGPFATPEDLRHVHGIGDRTVERLRPHLRIEPIPEPR